MNWEAMGVIAEIVGAAGVIITLIYVAIQIKQNTATTKSFTHQQLFDSVMEVNCRIADSSELAGLIVKANIDSTTLTAEEQIRLQFLLINWFTLWHSAFLSRKSDGIDERAWGVWDKGLITLLKQYAAVRYIWNELGHVFDNEFRSYVDAILEEIGPVTDGSGVAGE